ncbi:MAG: class I SAM-dependent methyltransferase [Desulfobacteraceae bacterium]|nr:class I SAM-dependent methyltransferase [Desulfobacteraceae bacterium]
MSPVFKDPTKQKQYIKDYFDEYSNQYHQDHYVKKRPPSIYPVLAVRFDYMKAMLSDFPMGGKVIDIGCGTGEMLGVFRERKFHAYGLDYSFKMLKALSGEIPRHTVSLVNGEIEALPFKDEQFDGIICAGVIEYLNEDHAALKEIARILNRGGYAIISLSNTLSPARVFEPLAHSVIGHNIKGKIKRRLLKKQTLLYPPFRTHRPPLFDREARHAGLIRTGHNFFHFSLVPWPFNKLLPRFYVSTGLKMERFSQSNLGFLGRGYIGKYKKQ